MKSVLIYLFLTLLASDYLRSQDNRVDSLNRRQGLWKYYIGSHDRDVSPLIHSGCYVNDLPFGWWTLERNGKQIAKANYENGSLHGPLFIKLDKKEVVIVNFVNGYADNLILISRREENVDLSNNGIRFLLDDDELFILNLFIDLTGSHNLAIPEE